MKVCTLIYCFLEIYLSVVVFVVEVFLDISSFRRLKPGTNSKKKIRTTRHYNCNKNTEWPNLFLSAISQSRQKTTFS